MVARDQIRSDPIRSEKAGTSGLFRYEAFAAIILLAMSGFAAAAPLKIELVAAEAVYNQQNAELLISFKMSAASGKAFADLIRNNVGRKLAIRVDGHTVSVPVIREPIVGGAGQISGHFTVEQVRDMAARLSSCAAKLEFEIVD
jgi:preprotein translocase subunit SecD